MVLFLRWILFRFLFSSPFYCLLCRLFLTVACSASFCVAVASANPPSESKRVTLRSLQDASSHSLNVNPPADGLYLLFQAHCHSCRQQVQQLGCLKDQPIYLIGDFSSEKALRLEYQKMKTPYPAYKASPEIYESWPFLRGLTPQVMGVKGGKKFVTRGLMPCLKIKALFEDQTSQ